MRWGAGALFFYMHIRRAEPTPLRAGDAPAIKIFLFA